MSFDLYNNSGRQVNNIKITATPQADGEIVPKSANIVQIDNLEENTSIPINFTFAATTSSKSQNYVISFLIEYETGATNDDDTKEIASFTQYQGVNINNPDSQDNNTKMSIPKIIVKEYSSSPVIVRSGQEFDLYMTFQNTNIDRSVKNIKAFLTVDEGTESKGSVFSPVNSSNTFYIDNIDPKGEVSQTLSMYTIPDAQPKTYTINVNFEYEDDNNESYSSIEKIGINVKQTTKLSLSEITVDEQAFVGEPLNINFEMYNTGKVTLSNLMIYVEGPFDTTQKSQYYGSFPSSSTEYYDNRLTPTEPGEQTLKVIISYEDDSGEEIREEKEILINVEEKIFEEPDPMLITDLDTTDSGSSSSSIILYIICFLILLILIVGFIFYRKHKKKKERFDLDE
jgi:hypothetical protein